MNRKDWEVVIGLEIHSQLNTQSKIFSGASTRFGASANAQASAVDIALPGTLPVMNKSAVEKAIRFGLAVGGDIARESIFARKNYFYPDLPKGYQISQFERPVVSGGSIEIMVDGGGQNYRKTITLTRAHLEEDAGKSLHEDYHGMSGIDLNRAGTPLLEIVSEPEMSSSAEAVAYAKAMHTLVKWIDVCDGNMQEGSFRCDANVSVRRRGAEKLGTRREIKNLNSFRFLQQAIEYEVDWQIGQLEDDIAIIQATVLFNPETGETRMMRTKEDAHDYRYFPDPDLPPLQISEEWIRVTRASMPELPDEIRQRLREQYALNDYDGTGLTSSRELLDYFLASIKICGDSNAKLCANWIMGELSARLKRENLDIAESPLSPQRLAGLLLRIADNTVSNNTAKQIFDALWQDNSVDADIVIERDGLQQVTDSGAISALIDEVVRNNEKSVAEFRSGKDKALNALVGQVMKASKGKANPAQVNELMLAKLNQ